MKTRNTDCTDAQRTYDGLIALGRIMADEVRRAPYRRKEGICAVCGKTLKVAYGVVDRDTGKVWNLAPDDPKCEEVFELGERFVPVPIYYCDILLDSWYLDQEEMRTISPVDMAYAINAKERQDAIRAAKESSSGEYQGQRLTGLDRLLAGAG